jgi:hypothetical protein
MRKRAANGQRLLDIVGGSFFVAARVARFRSTMEAWNSRRGRRCGVEPSKLHFEQLREDRPDP